MSGVVNASGQQPYKLVSRDAKEEDTVLKFRRIGRCPRRRKHIARSRPLRRRVRDNAWLSASGSSHGVRLFRGGAYKPRTSPYSFQAWAKKD